MRIHPLEHDVEARRVFAARRERDPHVERADALAEEGAVLMPIRAGVRGHPPQGALLHRQRRCLTEVVGNDAIESDLVEGLDEVEQRAGRIDGPDAALLPDPLPSTADGTRSRPSA